MKSEKYKGIEKTGNSFDEGAVERMREMKQSGIPWLDVIPERWRIVRIKNNFSISGGSTPTSDNPLYWDGEISWITPADMADFGTLCNGRRFLSIEGFNACGIQMASKGDIIISTRAPIGKVNICEKELCTNQGCKTLRNEKEDNRYFAYYLFSIQEVLNSLGKGTTFLELSAQDLGIFPLIFPPLPEQTAIANFLENKLQKIDALIETEEKIIFELKEYKKSFIQKAIDGNSANLETQRFTTFFTLGKGLPITKADLQDEGIPVVSYGEIHSKYGRELNPDRHPLKCVKDTYLKSDKACLLQYGDFVFADTSEDLEGSGNFTFLNSHTPVFAGYHTIIARPKIEVDFLFLSFLCDSYKFRKQIQSQVVGIKVFSITKDLLKNVNLWLPPLPEQKSIATYLDKKTGEVDKLISIKQNKITQLKEYKKSLIYEYVTGKKEVPA
jgi:type I restriction enzyme S subunit